LTAFGFKTLTFVLPAVLLVYAIWIHGSDYISSSWILPGLGLSILIATFAPRLSRHGKLAGRAYFEQCVRVFKDPIFYTGLAFVSLLLIQWLNSGRTLSFDEVDQQWIYSPPPIAHLPSAIDSQEARSMVFWFFPAWTAVLFVRSSRLGADRSYALCGLMAVNSALLATVGVIQHVSGTPLMSWVNLTSCYSFASFGYSNHAGEYFCLMLSLCVGLLAQALFFDSSRNKVWIGVLILCALLSLVGANLSLSRAAIVFSWGIAGLAVFSIVKLAWRLLDPAMRVNMLAGLIAVVCLGYFLVAGLGRGTIGNELATLGPRDPQPQQTSWDERTMLGDAAFRIWKDHPWVGVGAWGFRYMVALYVAPSLWPSLQAGTANIHNDPLQFMTEFGVLGAGLMAATVIFLLVPIVKLNLWHIPIVLFPLIGCSITFLHSLIDLPFRCPAILYSWLIILAAIPTLAKEKIEPHAATTKING